MRRSLKVENRTQYANYQMNNAVNPLMPGGNKKTTHT